MVNSIKNFLTKPNWHSRFFLIGLFVIFLGPLLSAWCLYQHGSFRGGHTTNNGTLITPPLALDKLGLVTSTNQPLTTQHQWLMLYYTRDDCDASCLQNLYKMRQIRVALNKEQNRVTRVLVDTAPTVPVITALNTDYVGTELASINNAKATLLFPLTGLYIVDPLGNVMMQYAPNANPKGILKDLNHLLRISQIG